MPPFPPILNRFFGGHITMMGWIFFGFGLIFVWVFGSAVDWGDVRLDRATLETAEGQIVSVGPTNATENDIPVYENAYFFRVERLETRFEGTSYSVGEQFVVEQDVTIEYLPDDPSISRIADTRRGQFSPWVLIFVGIFPLIGLVMLGAGFVYAVIHGAPLIDFGLGWWSLLAPLLTVVIHSVVCALVFFV